MVIVNKTSNIRRKKKIPYLNNLLREIEDKLHLERIQMENRWCFIFIFLLLCGFGAHTSILFERNFWFFFFIISIKREHNKSSGF